MCGTTAMHFACSNQKWAPFYTAWNGLWLLNKSIFIKTANLSRIISEFVELGFVTTIPIP